MPTDTFSVDSDSTTTSTPPQNGPWTVNSDGSASVVNNGPNGICVVVRDGNGNVVSEIPVQGQGKATFRVNAKDEIYIEIKVTDRTVSAKGTITYP